MPERMDPNTEPSHEEFVEIQNSPDNTAAPPDINSLMYAEIQSIRAQQQRDFENMAKMLQLVQARGNQNASATNEPLPARELHLNNLLKQGQIAQEEGLVKLEKRIIQRVVEYENQMALRMSEQEMYVALRLAAPGSSIRSQYRALVREANERRTSLLQEDNKRRTALRREFRERQEALGENVLERREALYKKAHDMRLPIPHLVRVKELMAQDASAMRRRVSKLREALEDRMSQQASAQRLRMSQLNRIIDGIPY